MALMSLDSIFVFILIFCFCKEATPSLDSPYYKLPTAIIPTKYKLHIETLIHQNVLPYNGSVSIDVTIREPTNEIILNANHLRNLNITLYNLESGLTLESPNQLEYEFDNEKEQLRIFWPEYPLKLQIGQQYRLKIDFVGKIADGEVFGFFKSTYLNDEGNPVQLAVTQFEPNSAHLAFPCFDEPAFKAKFIISITHGSNYSAVCNMPVDGDSILSSTPNGEMTTTTFLETPTMSPYLVAFALTDFKNISSVVNGLEHRFFYPPNSKNNGSLALQNAIKTVNVMEKLVGVKYSLPKLDHIQIPKLFGSAMENWGLMTFQDSEIISNQKNYSKFDLLNVIRVQNHEIAHQWFGNLVTPASWNYIWLKEGSSTYFSYVAANLVYPEDKVFELFLLNEVSAIYTLPPMNNTLTRIIKEGDDPKDNYNQVAYQYGGAFFRMFHHAIGHDTFMKGIFKYLFLYQYSVANEDDFFGAMQAAVDEDNVELFQNNQSVANVMQTWTHNKGIPIVSIVRNYETGTITIRQKSCTEDKLQKWWIPLSFATAANPDFERTVADYIMPPQAEVTIDLKDLNISLSNSDWLIVNKQQTALFFVVYDDLNLKMIAEALISNPSTIHEFNRAQIFRDINEIFEFDAIEPVLELLQYLKHEKESLAWYYAVDLIVKILPRLEGSIALPKFKNFIYDVAIGFYDEKYPNLLSSEHQFSAADIKTKIKMMVLKFEVDAVTCRNYTTQFAFDYIAFKNINDKDMPCKQSFCQAFQNLTFVDFITLLRRSRSTDETDTFKGYAFLSALECIEFREIFKLAFEIMRSSLDVNFLELFDHLLISNQYFEAWFLHYYDSIGKDDPDAVLIFNYRTDKINQRKTFIQKYENNISTWLENYEMKNQKKS
ncbi:aminopeptidase N-like [Eupeodes corollae]|uniref:aminopeptidase N-like n=1 Tax=Eupeodes corollae TaxID=290404 RepID=UPI0024905343|nr:aminopeptidase N-like [Eupeodes corollae]